MWILVPFKQSQQIHFIKRQKKKKIYIYIQHWKYLHNHAANILKTINSLTKPNITYFPTFLSTLFQVWIVSFVTPMFGAFFGLSLSRIFARNIRTSITIALETGIQNALLGRTIVGLFYPQPEADLITRVLLITATFTMIEGAGASLIYSLFRFVLCKERCKRMFEKEDEEENEQDKAVVRSDPESKNVYAISGRGMNGRYREGAGIDNPAMDINTGRV